MIAGFVLLSRLGLATGSLIVLKLEIDSNKSLPCLVLHTQVFGSLGTHARVRGTLNPFDN